MEKEFVYDAFISYRHTKLDTAVADKLQKRLERYVPPSSATEGKKAKKLRIFRDVTELPTSSNLSNDIKTALEKSRFLIVICSTTTAQSKWCMQEITYFKELHDGSTANIITLLTEGEPSEVFPPELCTETRRVKDADGIEHIETIDIEPLAANVSALTEKESLKKLDREFLRIAAPLFGCEFDDLYKRNQRRFVRRVVGVFVVVTLLLTAFLIYNSVRIAQISAQRNELEQKTIELEAITVELNEERDELAQRTIELEAITVELNEERDELARRNKDLLIQESRYLSRESTRLLDAGDRIGAINTALAALPTESEARPWIPQAEFALSQALYTHQSGSVGIDRRLEHSSPVEQVILSNDGTRLVSRDSQNNLYIWNPISGESIGVFHSSAHFASRGFVLCNNNRLYVATGERLICIDANTAQILWDIGRDVWDDPFFGANIILSNDEKIVALTSTNNVIFFNAASGEMKFHRSLLGDDTFFGASLDSSGHFSIDDEVFYISSSDSIHILGGSEPEIGTLFRVNIEAEEVIARELDNGSRTLGIDVDENTEFFVVAGYGGEDRDVVLAFSRETGEQLWEYVLSTGAGFRASAFIYSYNNFVFVASGNSAVVINADNGEMMTATTLSANILYCFVIPERPDRIVAVLGNGETRHTTLREGMFSPTTPLFGHGPVIYGDELYTVGIIFDSTHEMPTISNSMIYAFVSRNPQRNVGQPYVAIARYLGDDNYIRIDTESLLSNMIISEDGQLLSFVTGSYNDGFLLSIAEARTGEVLFERSVDVNHSSEITQVVFNTNNYIVVCTGAWLEIIDWRNDYIIKFDVYDVMEEEWSPQLAPRWNSIMAGKYVFFTNGWEHFLVNVEERSYQRILIDDSVRLGHGHFALNTNGELAVFSTPLFADNKLVLIAPNSAQPRLIDDDFIGRESFQTDLHWSEDGLILAAINNRNEAIVYDMRSLERVKVIPLISPVGISFTPDNEYLIALGANGILYKHSLTNMNQVRQLEVYDSATTQITRNIGVRMFEFTSLDGRDNIVLTAGNFENSYIIDIEEFAFRRSIPHLGVFNEQHRIFAQHDSRAVRIRHFYTTDELVEMALAVLNE